MEDKVLQLKPKDTGARKHRYTCLYKPDVVGDVEVSDYKEHIKLEFKRGKFVVFVDPKGKSFQILRSSEIK